MDIKKISLGPLGTNCYILSKESSALIIDPGGDADQVIAFLEQENVTPLCILLTHAHFDHMGGVERLRTHYQIKVYLHEAEAEWLMDPKLNRSYFFEGGNFVTSAPDDYLQPGPTKIGPFHFKLIHTPGHSPGSVTLIFADNEWIISGDVLFRNGVGRTDLPEGSFEQLESTLRQKIYKLPDNYTVFPGHGEQTKIGIEKKSNPFISG